MKLKSFVVTVAFLLQISIVGGQTFCNRSLVSEWKTQPTVHTVKWSLSQDICSSFFTECWNIDSYHGNSTADNMPLRLSQICPLQLQLGDLLFVSSEPSFQSYGMNLANVSLEGFIRCPQPRDVHQHQLLFDHGLNGMHQIVPKWLGVGTHYFAEVPIRGPLLCHFGLRLNVTVKSHTCQKFSNSTFCSGHGKCLSHIWDGAYHCHCSHPYSGQFCQEIDKCSSKPCHNSGICISRKSQREDAEDSYECICPPSFAGKITWISETLVLLLAMCSELIFLLCRSKMCCYCLFFFLVQLSNCSCCLLCYGIYGSQPAYSLAMSSICWLQHLTLCRS